MYGLLWRALPGPVWLRIIFLLILTAGVVYACFEWVFPAIAPHMPFNDQTVADYYSPPPRSLVLRWILGIRRVRRFGTRIGRRALGIGRIRLGIFWRWFLGVPQRD